MTSYLITHIRFSNRNKTINSWLRVMLEFSSSTKSPQLLLFHQYRRSYPHCLSFRYYVSYRICVNLKRNFTRTKYLKLSNLTTFQVSSYTFLNFLLSSEISSKFFLKLLIFFDNDESIRLCDQTPTYLRTFTFVYITEVSTNREKLAHEHEGAEVENRR